ncbi:hypothetical protein ACWGJW_37985, partial [Streptomyces nigrescens]
MASADDPVGTGGRQEAEAAEGVHDTERGRAQVEFADDGGGQQRVEDRDDHAPLGVEQDEAAHPQRPARRCRDRRLLPGGGGSRRPV